MLAACRMPVGSARASGVRPGGLRNSVRVFCSSPPAPAPKEAPAAAAKQAPKRPSTKPNAPALAKGPAAPPASAKASAPAKPAIARPARGPDNWSKMMDAEKTGATIDVVVQGQNAGGLVVKYADVPDARGFIPYNQLTQSAQGQDMSFLIGQTLKVKVVSTDTTNGRKDFVVSERKVQQSEAMRYIKMGGTVKAVVSSVVDYGAFVELVDVPGVQGLVHKSELSWDSVLTADAVVHKGQVITAKVIDLDLAKGRLALSLKQMQPDPIKVTMDTVEWGPTKSMPAEMEQLMNRLKQQQGVEDVTIGRQAVESKIASQELGVYLTKDSNADGFNVVARLGNLLQELRVVSKMSRDEARQMLARIAQAQS